MTHIDCLKRFFSVLAEIFHQCHCKRSILNYYRKIEKKLEKYFLIVEHIHSLFLHSLFQDVLLALCICRQDRHKYLAIQSMAAEKKSVRKRDYWACWVTQMILRSFDSPCMQSGLEPALQRTMVQNSQHPFHRFSCWPKAALPSHNTQSGHILLAKPVHAEALPDVCQGDERYLGYLASLTLAGGRPHLQAPCWCFVHAN